ncbi:transposase [Tautonia sp. JC769]|uniref:REP-associated tyrosine transposase n=1 Tax=Tautonia sp. JC769 TaxID=3232135 RepID=UPI0034591AD5
MPHYRRFFVPGGTYFFTVVTERRIPLLCIEAARRHLRQAMSDCRRRWPFRIEAIVLLPDHLHTVWSLPPNDADYSTRWAWIKKEFTIAWLDEGGSECEVSDSKRRHRRRGVWQRRFWEHCIDDEDDLARHVDYIHFNPVKHGLVRCARDWPYSTFHRFAQRGAYPLDWGCATEPPPTVKSLDSTAME